MRVIKRFLAKNTPFMTPYYIIKGSSEGHTVMITSGVHGNERAGVMAANQLVAQLQKDTHQIKSGILIIVPIVNQTAYKRRIRGTPDLNRTFPRKTGDMALHPLSDEIFQLAKKHKPTWYFDLHEANGLSNITPRVLGQSMITNPSGEALPSIKRIIAQINRTITPVSKHFTIKLHSLPGSGRTAAYRLLNAKAVTLETCWSLPIADRVHYQSEILSRLLKEAGLMNPARPPMKSKEDNKPKQVEAQPTKPALPPKKIKQFV